MNSSQFRWILVGALVFLIGDLLGTFVVGPALLRAFR